MPRALSKRCAPGALPWPRSTRPARDNLEIAAELSKGRDAENGVVQHPRGAVPGAPTGKHSSQRRRPEVVHLDLGVESSPAKQRRRSLWIEFPLIRRLILLHESRSEQPPGRARKTPEIGRA